MSLTRTDAIARFRAIRVTGYRIELDLTGTEDFGSRTTIGFGSESGEATFVDVATRQLVGATLNGTPLDLEAFDRAAHRLTITPAEGDNELIVDARMAYSNDGEGLHRHVDPADGRSYLYAMSFLDAGPRWFACFDQPDLKAPVELEVRCPADWTVAANGTATEIEPGLWRAAATAPMSTYVVTVVAGPYHRVSSEHDGIRLHLLVRASLTEHLDRDAAELFALTGNSFDALHELFGVRYPWGDYVQAFVPDLTASAMENPGCVTLGDAYIFRSRATTADHLDRAVTMAHEMAHMWFGDLVTMRWWDDLWLNESFAEYLGARVTGGDAWVDFGIGRKSWGYRADRRPSTHPVAGNGAADAAAALSDFDGISYAKGASALRQLALHLGEQVFVDGLRRYIAAHAYGNAEFTDLLAAWTAAGGADLPDWTEAWLRTTGLDDLAVADGQLTRHAPDGTPRPHRITVAAYDGAGVELAAEPVRVAADRTQVTVPADAALALPDAGDETWSAVRLTAAEWAAMPDLLPRIGDVNARVTVWNALLLAAADGLVDPRLALRIATAALPAETDESVIATVGTWAVRTVAGAYLPDAERPDRLAAFADALHRATADAEPGSGRQLAAARVAAGAATDPSVLRGWLDGRAPDGVVVDAELRWTLLTRSAELGALTVADVDAEAARDRTSQGEVAAARCRASVPDPAAKAWAWDRIVSDAHCGVQELYATADGLWVPGQDAVTAPYVDRYFAEIAATARLRTGWVVEKVAGLAFPWSAVDPTTAAAAERLLAVPDLDAGIRRSVVDAADDLRRAVSARGALRLR